MRGRLVPPKMSAPGICALALALSILITLTISAAAQYRLQPGDTLEVSIIGIPDLRQRATVGLDSEIALPLVGAIKVGGLSVLEARGKIVQSYANKVYHQHGADGRDIQRLIGPDEIVVTATEYRPIYVAGEVSKAGEYVFRPGMTVRHAITLAGGYDWVRIRLADPFLQAADFQSEYAALWAEYASEQSRIWRLRVELGETGVAYKSSGTAPGVPSDFGDRLQKAEMETLEANLADRHKDKASLRAAIDKANRQLDILAEKKKNDEEGNEADMADLQKVRELFQKGMTPTTRLADARRAALLSADQLLQTIVEVSNIERQRADYSRQVDKIDSQSRVGNWKELQQSNLRLAQIAARLKSTGDKLMYAGALESRAAEDGASRVKITVFRKSDDTVERIAATEDLQLAPGDVVEATLDRRSPLGDARAATH